MKLAAKQLRVSEPTKAQLAKIKRRDIYIICDNVLDTYNIGSIFRLADAVGVKCVYLCGESETPPNHRIAKASIGTDKWVPWKYFATAAGAIADLKGKFSLRSNNKKADRHSGERSDSRIKKSRFWTSQNDSLIRIVAIEQAKGSKDYRKIDYRKPIAFVVGHETDGVSEEALKLCDEIVEIPMFGVNISLNVMVSLAIVLYRTL